MPIPLINPELQFLDADGHPYAGGTVGTYVPGTTTFKETWADMEGTASNSNPVVLDAAGRAKIYGSGDYRLILQDATGSLVFDTDTTSIASDAMQPVVSAPTIAEAQRLLGIEDWSSQIAAETARAEAAEASLFTNITNETAGRVAGDTNLQNQITAEVARAEGAEANLQSQITTLEGQISSATTRAGTLTADVNGNFTVTFTPPFANGVGKVDIGSWNATLYPIWILVPTVTYTLSLTTWTGMVQQENGTPVPNAVANWYGVGW